MDELHDMYENLTLSPAADERIRAALAAAQAEGNVVALRPVKRARTLRRTARTALIAAACAGLLTVTALAAGIVGIALTERQVQSTDIGTGETETLTEVGFETGPARAYLLGVWAPAALPEGFAETESFYGMDYASVTWERPGGGRLDLQYTKGGNAPGSKLLPSDQVAEREAVTVNGGEAVLYTLGEDGNYRLLAWTDEAAGVGFTLTAQAGAEDVDILSLAESVALTGETPEASQNAADAIVLLGDWAVTELPAGYSAYYDQGAPGTLYNSDYSYVYRYYTDAAGHTLALRYETPVNDSYEGYVENYRTGFAHPADAPKAVCTVTDTAVQGLPAGLVEYPDGRPLYLVWLAEDGSVAFLLSGDGLDSEALLAAAESVKRLAPATAETSPAGSQLADASGVLVTPQP